MVAPIWLPQLFDLDRHLFGAIEDTVRISPEADVAGNSPRRLLGALNLKPTDIKDFLLDISPSLTALFLAGYRVRSLELGFRNLPFQVGAFQQSDYWLRFNFDERSIEINPRGGDEQFEGQNVVRFRCEKIAAGGVDRAIALGPEIHEQVFQEWAEWPPGPQTYPDPGVELFFTELFGDGENGLRFAHSGIDDEPRGLYRYRKELTDPIAYYLGELGGPDAPEDVIVNLKFAFEGRGLLSEKLAAREVLKAFRVTFFDSLLAFAGRGLMEEVQQHFSAEGEAEAQLPGMLFMLDPTTWASVATDKELTRHETMAVDLLTDLFGRKFDSLNNANHGIYSDYETPKDPPESLVDEDGDILEVVVAADALSRKSSDLLGTRFFYESISFADPAEMMPCARIEMLAVERLLDVQLGQPGKRDRREIRRALREQLKQIDDGNFDPSLHTPGVLGTLLDMPHPTPNQTGPICEEDPKALRAEVRQVLKRLRKLGEKAEPPSKGSMAPSPDVGEDGPFVGFRLAGLLKEVTFLEALFLLFNFGVYELEEISEVAAGFVIADEVYERLKDNDDFELLHTQYSDFSITLQASGNMSGELRDNFAWSFLPRPKHPVPQELIDHFAAVEPHLATQLSQEIDRVVIVAAPGVSIGGLATAPANCPVSVYRVQSLGLVPNPGEAIIPGQLLSKIPASVLSDLDPSYVPEIVQGERVETPLDHGLDAVLDAFEAKPGSLPMLQVSPLDVSGKSGVKIEKVPTTEKPDRHAAGHAVVAIEVDDPSGNQRFAYDFRFSTQREQRANWRDDLQLKGWTAAQKKRRFIGK